LTENDNPMSALSPDQIIIELKKLGDIEIPGQNISRLDHSLQAATRAANSGADIDWIVSSLLHDIGESLAPSNHDRFSAEVVRPFVREEITWVVEHHGIFQMEGKERKYGWDVHAVDRYQDHIYFETCREFAEKWDLTSFNQEYPTHSLDHFEPMIREVFSRKPFDPDTIQSGVVKGLPSL